MLACGTASSVVGRARKRSHDGEIITVHEQDHTKIRVLPQMPGLVAKLRDTFEQWCDLSAGHGRRSMHEGKNHTTAKAEEATVGQNDSWSYILSALCISVPRPTQLEQRFARIETLVKTRIVTGVLRKLQKIEGKMHSRPYW